MVLGVHAHKYPDFSGWAGVDQHRYLEAARAWAQGDLSPARHHYLPFYPLMGAAFVHVTPWQPFMLPDLACLLASLAVFLRIARRLAPGWPAGVAALCFTVGVLSGRTDAAVWVVPWSTTGSAPFQFLAVLLALRFAEQPGALRAGLFGLCVAAVAGFRPSDAAVLLAAGGAYAAWALARGAYGVRTWLGCAAAGLAGLLAGLTPAAAAHLAVFGWSSGPYVGESAAIGLEWRLLPVRWVMLVCGARPALPEGAGMAFVLPWLAPGLAGMLLALAAVARRPACALVAGTVALHWMLYLAYRDLQPYGLWRFYNIHYFKWTFPFLVLWAAQLLAALLLPGRRRVAAGACVAAALLLCWRPVLRGGVTFSLRAPDTAYARVVSLPADALRFGYATFLPLSGDWEALYFSVFTLSTGGQEFVSKSDLKILPVPGGALLLPLRVLPAGEGELGLPKDVSVDAAVPGIVWRQALVFGLPYGI